MRKRLILAGVLSGMLLTAGPAFADKPGDNGATVTKGEGCFLPLPPNENGEVFGFPDTDAKGHYVTTPSGNSHSHCHGQLPADETAPASAVVLENFQCTTQPPSGGNTENSKAVITPSGRVNTNCHQKG